jgi:hypothetical protein
VITRKIAASALVAALTLATTVTATVAPAYAATPAPVGAGVESERVTFLPDVRVRYIGRTNSGLTVNYRYRIENIGAATAEHVALNERVFQAYYDWEGDITIEKDEVIASLAPGQSVIVSVPCTPLPLRICEGSYLEATLANDLDTNNNRDANR